MDAEGVVRFFRKTDAVVADAEAQLAGLSLELLDIALTGLGEAKECGGCAWRCRGRGGGCRRGRARTRRFSSRLVFPLFEIFRSEAEIGEHFFVGNPLTAVLLKPSLRLGNGLAFLFGLGFIVEWSVGDGEGRGIEHGFEQADNGGELRRRKPVDQFVGVLFGVGHESSFPSILTQCV